MKKYIALIAIALFFVSASVASPSVCRMSSQDTVVHDTVIVYDTVYSDIHDTVYVPSADAEDTIYVHDTLQIELEYGDIMTVASAPFAGKVAGSGHFPNGTVVELGAVPAKGYRFVRWQDNSTANPRQVEVNGNMVFTAFFDTIPSAPQAKGARRAMAAEQDTTIVYDTIRDTIVIVRHDTITLPAVVLRDTVWVDTNQYYDVIILSGNEEKGLVSGNGRFMKGAEVEIAAIPAAGYRFVFWHDGEKANPRKLTVDDIQIFVAEFAVDTAQGGDSDDPDDPDVKPYEPVVNMLCDGLALSVTCPANAMVRIFNTNGRVLFQSEGTGDKRDNTVRSFQLPQSGVYLVQVANFPVRKVAIQEGYQHKL